MPYSEHSSYKELREYVKFLKPQEVGIISISSKVDQEVPTVSRERSCRTGTIWGICGNLLLQGFPHCASCQQQLLPLTKQHSNTSSPSIDTTP